MNIKIVNQLLPEFEYFKEPHQKNQIVLHHTVSNIGKYVADWFKADRGKSKIAVPYVIEKDGTIYKLFEPEYWAWHIGKGSNTKHNAHSIAIELVNEGVLYKRDNGEFYWWIDEKNPQGKYRYKDKTTELKESYRGYKYFANYTDEQIEALLVLLGELMDKFKIEPQFSNTFEYDEKFRNFNGIVMHCNLRSDKTDLSPAFDLKIINKFIEDYKKKPLKNKSNNKNIAEK